MHCRQAEERMQTLLDERTPILSDVHLRSHLAECGSCRELARTYERMALAFLPAERALASADRQAEGTHWSRLPVPAALAAAVAGMALWISQGSGPWEPRIADGGRVELPARVDAGPARGNAAAKPLDSFNSLLAWAPMSATLMSMGQLPSPAQELVEPVSGGFKPVARSVEAAFGAMRDTVLGPEPSARS